jgi:hypothetical protein
MFRFIIILFCSSVFTQLSFGQKPSIFFYHCDIAPTDSAPCENSNYTEHMLEAVAIKKIGNRMDTTWKRDVYISFVFYYYDYAGPLDIKVYKQNAYFDKDKEYHTREKLTDSVTMTKPKEWNYIWRKFSFSKEDSYWIRLYINGDLVSEHPIFVRKPEEQ